MNLLQHHSQDFLALPAADCEAEGSTLHLQHSVEGAGRVTADGLHVLVRNLKPRLLPIVDLRMRSRLHVTVFAHNHSILFCLLRKAGWNRRVCVRYLKTQTIFGLHFSLEQQLFYISAEERGCSHPLQGGSHF